jgi:hypothetical protein
MDKWLKRPNSPNIVEVELIVGGLVAIVEILIPRSDVIVLSRTPIVDISKTTKPLLV